MAFIDILADVSGLVAAIDRNTAVETRIAEALERLSPPVPLPLDPSDRRFEFTASYIITTGGG